MARYLNPRSDLVFKKIFGERKHLLISFLNSLLPIPELKEQGEPEITKLNPDPQIKEEW